MNDVENLPQQVVQWSDVFNASLKSQATFLEVLDEQLAVEYQTLMGTAIAPETGAVLQEAVFDRTNEAWRAEIDADQHEAVEVVIESVHSRRVLAYDDYLQRHWLKRPDELSDAMAYDARIAQLLEAHLQSLQELLGANLDAHALRQSILELQAAWHAQQPLRALA